MNFGKVVISFLLLLTYSFGFVHSLVPHYQVLDLHMSGAHQHHTPNDTNSLNHELISHNDHFDEDLFDLIVCVFNETKHPANGCEIQHYLPTETIDVSTKDITKVKFTTLLLAASSVGEQNEAPTRYGANDDLAYLSPTLEDSPLRGPPSMS